MESWIDFKAIKAAVTIDMLLARYKIDWLRKTGKDLRGRCPIHNGDGQNTFHVSLVKNAFHCFSCKARGNALDFVSAMEKCSVRDAALKLQQWFEIPSAEVTAAPDRAAPEKTTINNPLGFQLRGIEHEHAYLKQRGVTPETAKKFGVGFFGGKGSMAGRIVIPIHNHTGELLAYAGRAVDSTEPKYKLPTGFHKSLELYNLNRIGETHKVVLVEGFFDAIVVAQAGFPVTALMGSSLSEEQARLIIKRFANVILMFDGDDAGRKATAECVARLGAHVWMKVIALADGEQPDGFTTADLNARLTPLLQ